MAHRVLVWTRHILHTPGRRVYLGKLNKVEAFAQKCYLLWTIRDIMGMINGSKIMEYSSTMSIIGSFANSIICSSVTNNSFSIERTHIFLSLRICENTLSVGADHNHCGSWLGEYEPIEEWLQCPICNVWFRNNCFFDW